MSAEYTLHTLSRPEIDLAVDWAAAEGWNPGLRDADAFHAADPGGFLAGRLNGETVAVISAVKYGADFGFVGFYIVHPDQRGRGYGLRLWQAAMERLAGRNVGLDGVVAQQDNYRKSGFALAYRNIRYQGEGGGTAPAATVEPAMESTAESSAGFKVEPLQNFPDPEIVAYDRAFFPADRATFLRVWLATPGHVALGLRQDGRLAGYGVLRPCRTGCKIGPLFADRPAQAEALFLALKAQAPAGTPLFLDVPETNPAALALAERHGMGRVFETARMYTRGEPGLPLQRTYGVTSFELG